MLVNSSTTTAELKNEFYVLFLRQCLSFVFECIEIIVCLHKCVMGEIHITGWVCSDSFGILVPFKNTEILYVFVLIPGVLVLDHPQLTMICLLL